MKTKGALPDGTPVKETDRSASCRAFNTGAAGYLPVPGRAGPQGEQGEKGNTGPRGERGEDGEKGEDGQSLTIMGDATVEQMNAKNPADYPPGSSWQMIDSGTITSGATPLDVLAEELVSSGAEGTWVNLGMIRGPEGEQGEKGDKGDKGDQGDPGAGIPAGGTIDDFLVKANDTDYNTTWRTLSVDINEFLSSINYTAARDYLSLGIDDDVQFATLLTKKDQNADTILTVENATSGNLAAASVVAHSNGSIFTVLQSYSPAFGVPLNAGKSVLRSVGANLMVLADAGRDLELGAAGKIYGRIEATKGFLSTGGDFAAAVPLHVKPEGAFETAALRLEENSGQYVELRKIFNGNAELQVSGGAPLLISASGSNLTVNAGGFVFINGDSGVFLQENGQNAAAIRTGSTGKLATQQNNIIGWSGSDTDANNSPNTALSRISSGVVGIGNGTHGDTSGIVDCFRAVENGLGYGAYGIDVPEALSDTSNVWTEIVPGAAPVTILANAVYAAGRLQYFHPSVTGGTVNVIVTVSGSLEFAAANSRFEFSLGVDGVTLPGSDDFRAIIANGGNQTTDFIIPFALKLPLIDRAFDDEISVFYKSDGAGTIHSLVLECDFYPSPS